MINSGMYPPSGTPPASGGREGEGGGPATYNGGGKCPLSGSGNGPLLGHEMASLNAKM